MIRGTILLLCLLISNWSYSQIGYPRRIVYNGDTVIAITTHQMQSINLAHVTWRECKEVQDSLLTVLDSCSAAFILYDTTIRNLRTELSLYQHAVMDRDIIISTHQRILADRNKEIRKLKVHRALLFIADGVLLIAVAAALIL